MMDASLPWALHEMSFEPTPLADIDGSPSLSSSRRNNAIGVTPAPNNLIAELSGSTTLCTTAFSLVLDRNARGYSSEYLDSKLKSGYRLSTMPLEGCRIENHVLLEVLVEIA
jgi:hypothetical protein